MHKRSLLSFIYPQLEFPGLPASSAPSPGISFISSSSSVLGAISSGFLLHWRHANPILCKWLLYSSPLGLKAINGASGFALEDGIKWRPWNILVLLWQGTWQNEGRTWLLATASPVCDSRQEDEWKKGRTAGEMFPWLLLSREESQHWQWYLLLGQ